MKSYLSSRDIAGKSDTHFTTHIHNICNNSNSINNNDNNNNNNNNNSQKCHCMQIIQNSITVFLRSQLTYLCDKTHKQTGTVKPQLF